MRQDGSRDFHDAEDVYVELLKNFLTRRRFKEAKKTEARVIDHCIDAPEAFDACLNGLLDAGVVLDVKTLHQHIIEPREFCFRFRSAHRRNDIPTLGGKEFGG